MHKAVCATLSAQKINIKPFEPAQQKYADDKQTRKRAKTLAVVMNNIKTATNNAAADADNTENELFSLHLDVGFSTSEVLSLRSELKHARESMKNSLAAAFSAQPSADSVPIVRNIDNAFNEYSVIRDKIIDRLAPESREAMQRREIDAMIEIAFDNMVAEARAEIGQDDEPIVQDVDSCIDWVKNLLATGTTSTAQVPEEVENHRARKRGAATARLHSIAARKGMDEQGFWRGFIDFATEKFKTLDTTLVGRITIKLVGLVTMLTVTGGVYYGVQRWISPDRFFDAARKGIETAKTDLNNVNELNEHAARLITEGDAIQEDKLSGMFSFGRILNAVRDTPDESPNSTVEVMRALMRSALNISKQKLNDACDLQFDTETARLAATGTTEVIQTCDTTMGTILEGYQTDLISATSIVQLKELAQKIVSNQEVWSHANTRDAATANAVYKKFLAEGLAKLAGSTKEIERLIPALEKTIADIDAGVTRMEYTRSTSPVMTAVARACGKYIGFAGEGFAVFLQLTILSQAIAVEATFASFLNDVLSSQSVFGVLAAAGGLLANIVAGYLTGQTSGFLSHILGDTVHATTQSLEDRAYRSRSYYAQSTTGGSKFGYAAWTLIYETVSTIRGVTKMYMASMRAKSVVMAFSGIGMSVASAFIGISITVAQLNVYATGTVAAGLVCFMAYNYVCKATPVPMATIISRVAHFMTSYGHWFTRYAVLLIAAVSMLSFSSVVDVNGAIGRLSTWYIDRVPDWNDVNKTANAGDAELVQIETAASTLATYLSTLGSKTVSAEGLLGVKKLVAAGVELPSL